MARPKRRPTRLSQEVVRKQRPAVDIEESARTNAPKVASDLESFLLRGLPEGQTLPDLVLLQVILGNVVRADAQAMEVADEAHFEEVSRYNKLRKQRDGFRDRLFPALGNLRDTRGAGDQSGATQRDDHRGRLSEPSGFFSTGLPGALGERARRPV